MNESYDGTIKMFQSKIFNSVGCVMGKGSRAAVSFSKEH